ncbi:MAG: insulinase family protein, partial [Candidatus Thermochlorobacter sp.]
QESMSSRASHLARDLYYFGRDMRTDEIIERIDTVRAKDIQSLAETLFDEAQYSTLIYMPKKKRT